MAEIHNHPGNKTTHRKGRVYQPAVWIHLHGFSCEFCMTDQVSARRRGPMTGKERDQNLEDPDCLPGQCLSKMLATAKATANGWPQREGRGPWPAVD